MREIKIRYVIKDDEGNDLYITDPYDVYLTLDGELYTVDNDKLEAKLLQYTGLKDKNGKEIYEGDIVKVESVLVYPFDNKIPVSPPKKSVKYYRIGWHKKGCWNKFESMSDEHTGIIGVKQPHIWCEVIGNIYENPELLKR